jgi:4-hydroxy-tetrahydrodipicolinate reductase
MKIILAGYGKMGRMVESVAQQRGHSIITRFDQEADWAQLPILCKEADLVIEFSQPNMVLDNIRRCLEAGIPVVVGTTGWHSRISEVREMVERHDGALLWASNFSVGMNLFFALNRFLTGLMTEHPQYRASITEIHHNQKLDQPSGTAITLANDLIALHPDYASWVNLPTADGEELPVESIREGDVSGTHIIRFQTEADQIELKHEAFNRMGFAEGAVLGAEYLLGRKGIFEFREVLFTNQSINKV